ncbi:hypothetical protein GCM10027598_53000 [Amycolatopsis oliviviridis]|uniref:Outer membrane channel protein CpnT-like N-terminal domain-containing protein n=1 Tax=Amycolatopsis oliviviridis TaxID=1471590 RepID=A0ABQ3MF16_9PSEU|nr:hypothetical protein GCM10017790_84150 [Amycolatopsis oliviviridis]
MSGGSVKLPAELQTFFLVTLGMPWPEGDDAALSELARAWREFEAAAEEYREAVRAGGVGVPAALVGETGEFFTSYLGGDVVSGVEALGESASGLAGMAKTAAADVVKAKVMMIAMAAMALATIIHLLATLIGAAFVGLAQLTARQALMAIWRGLVAKMHALVTMKLNQELGIRLVKAIGAGVVAATPHTVKFALAGAGIMGGLDLSIQTGQIAAGKRDELDGKSLLGSFGGGALGGAFAGIFHAGAVWARSAAAGWGDNEAARLLAERMKAEGVTLETLKEAGERLAVAPRAIPGSVEALGHLSYGIGQVGVVFITAPVINLATGSPHASPWLGMLGALSGFGGGRGGGGAGGRLDALLVDLGHLPKAVEFTIPAADVKTDIKTDVKTGSEAKVPVADIKTDFTADVKAGGKADGGVTTGERLFLEPPPSYADTIAADAAQRLVASTTPGQAIGTLFTPAVHENPAGAVVSAADTSSTVHIGQKDEPAGVTSPAFAAEGTTAHFLTTAAQPQPGAVNGGHATPTTATAGPATAASTTTTATAGATTTTSSTNTATTATTSTATNGPSTATPAAQTTSGAEAGRAAPERNPGAVSETAAARDTDVATSAQVPEAKAVDTASTGPQRVESAPATTTTEPAPAPEAPAVSEPAPIAAESPQNRPQPAVTRPAAAETTTSDRATLPEKSAPERTTGDLPARPGKTELTEPKVETAGAQSGRSGAATPARVEGKPVTEAAAHTAQSSDTSSRPAPARLEPDRKIAEPIARAAEVRTSVTADAPGRPATGVGRDENRGQTRDEADSDEALLIPVAYVDETPHTAVHGEEPPARMGRAEWAEWEKLRGTLTATPYKAERFEPYAKGESDDGKLGGRITQIRFTVRRGQVANGTWIREIAVPLALVSDDVDQKTRETLIESLQKELATLEAATDPHLLRLGNGDRAHLRLEAVAADGFAEGWDRYSGESLPVTVKNGEGETNQVQWFLGSGTGAMLHEIIHAAGGKDGYRDATAGARREQVRGIMGPSPETERFIARETMAVLDGLSLAAGDHGGGLRNPDPARAGSTSVVSSEPYNSMHRPAEAPKPKKDPDPPPPLSTHRRGSSGSRPRSQGSDSGTRGLWRRSNPSLGTLPLSPSMPTLIESDAEARAGYARLVRPSLVAVPDFEPIRAAVLAKVPKYEEWVRENLSDAKLADFGATLDGLKQDISPRLNVTVEVHAIDTARNPIDRTTESVTSSEHLAKTIQAADQIERTPVNPTSFSAPAGPVTVSGGIRGIGSASQSGVVAKRTSSSAFDVTEQRQGTRSRHDVTYRVKVFEKAHSRGTRERDPGDEVVLDLELDWPKNAPVEPLTPADPAGGRPSGQRAIDFAEVHKRIKHVELKGTKKVFDAIVEQLDLKERRDGEVVALKTWLDNLGGDHGKELVTGGLAKRTFEFRHRERLEILVRRHKPEAGSRPHSSHAGGSQSSIGHRRSSSALDTDERSGTREWGGSLGSGFGESLSDLVGAKVSVNASYARSASDSERHATSLEHESIEQLHGAFEKHDEDFPFAVTIMPESGDRPVSRGSGSSAGRRPSTRDGRVYELVVPGSVHVYLAEAGQMDSESSMAFGSGSDGQASSKAGMTVKEVPDRAASHWKIAESDRKTIAGIVAAVLRGEEEITDHQSQAVQDDLAALLGEPGRVRELVAGTRMPLPGERSLFIDAQVARGRGHYVKQATWKELASKVAVGETSQVGSSRLREGMLSIEVEADAGPVTILGSVSASREHERAWNVGQSIRKEQGWPGGADAVHLFNYPMTLNFRVGTDWANIDKELEFEDPEAGVPIPGLQARLQVAAPARRGVRVGVGIEHLDETTWGDQAGLNTSALRPGGRPVRSELDSLQALLDFPATIIEGFSGLLPEPDRTRDRVAGAVKHLAAGEKPTPLGIHHEGESARDASQQKIETWAGHAARQARLPLTAKSDVLPLDSFNEGGFFATGSRDLHGTAELKTDLLEPQILRRDDAHVFADTTRTTTELSPEERRKLGAGASAKATVPTGGLATVGAEAKAGLARERSDDGSETVVDETHRETTERGYLVAWDHRHRLALSVLEGRTGMLGGRHTGEAKSRSLEKYVPMAELRWVPASALAEIGELPPAELKKLHPDDQKALSAGTQARSSSGNGPEDILGDLDPADSSVVPRLIANLTTELRAWEAKITEPKVQREFRELHDEMLGSLGTHLALGGFGDTVRAMLRGGAVRFGRRFLDSGKLEQVLVLKARLPHGQENPAGFDYRVESSSTTTTRHRDGVAWEKSYGVTAEGTPKLPIPEFTGSSKLGLDQAIAPHAGVQGARTTFRGPEWAAATTVKFAWNGKATQRTHDLEVWVEVHPWARSGVYARHVPGIRHQHVREIEKLSPSTLDAVVRSTLPAFLTDSGSPSPTMTGSLREHWADDGRGASWPDDAALWGFPVEAPKLYAEIHKTVESMNAERTFAVLVATQAPLLGRRLPSLLSEDGYLVDVGSRTTIDSVRIKLDLGDRYLVREIEGASLTVGRDAATKATVERSHEGTVSGGLLGGPVSGLVGELGKERQFGAPAEEVPIELGGTPEGRGDGVFWVSAVPDFTMIFKQANGKEGKPLRIGPDGRIDLLVDRAGLAALGLEPPAGTRGGLAPGIPSIAIRVPTAISRTSTFASDRTIKAASARNPAGEARSDATSVHRAVSREKDLKILRKEFAALGGTTDRPAVRVEVDERFQRLETALDNVPAPIARQVLDMVRGAMFTTGNIPVREVDIDGVTHRQTIRPVFPETFGRLLDTLAHQLEQENNPFREGGLFAGLGPQKDEALLTRLAHLATVNLPRVGRDYLLQHPAFHTLLSNPDAVKEALYAAGELEPDRRAPAGAAVNSALRARVPLLTGLIVLGVAGVTRFLNDGDRYAGLEVQPAREEQLVKAARAIRETLRKALDTTADLADRERQDPKAWHGLSEQWANAMQQFAVVAGVGLETHAARADAYARYVAEGVLPASDVPSRPGELTSRVPLASWLSDGVELAAFWERLAAGAGHVLAGAELAVFVQARRSADGQVFAVTDPEGRPVELNPAAFRDWAEEKGLAAPLSLFPAARTHGPLLTVPFSGGLWAGARDSRPVPGTARPGMFELVLAKDGERPQPHQLAAALRGSAWNHADEIMLSGRDRADLELLGSALSRDLGATVRHEFERGKAPLLVTSDGHLTVGGLGAQAAPVRRPADEITALPLPLNLGVAFVDPAFTRNLTGVFENHPDDRIPVAVHHRDGRFFLPDARKREIPHDPFKFAEALASQPLSLVTWVQFSKISLFACDLTNESLSKLKAALVKLPVLAHLDVEAIKLNTRIHITPDSDVLFGDQRALPDGTLSLTPPGAIVPVLADPASADPGLSVARFGEDGVPPAEFLTWRPGDSGSTLLGHARQLAVSDLNSRLAARLGSGESPEVRDRMGEPMPESWVRAWLEGTGSPHHPLGSFHEADTFARESGHVVNAWEVAQAWGRARVSQETRLDEHHAIPAEDRVRIEYMVDGFVDAAVQAPTASLPRVRSAVFVAPGSLAGTDGLGAVVESRIRLRLSSYPPGVVTVTADQLLAQVSVSALTRPEGDPQIGVVQVHVEGQRALSGLYGPEAYSLPGDRPSRHWKELDQARADLARLADGAPVLARAGEIMNRLHQPPRVFVEREPSRVHQAHRERHRAATDLVAWELLWNGEQAAIERARGLVTAVGWPRRGGVVGGAPRADQPAPSTEAGSSRAAASTTPEEPPPPADVIAWQPPFPDTPGPRTLDAYVAENHTIAGQRNFDGFIGSNALAMMPLELWEMVREHLRNDGTPASWARAWAENMSPRQPLQARFGGTYGVAAASGGLLNPSEVQQAWNRARTTFETRLSASGELDGIDRHFSIGLMIDGFVDAALQPPPRILPEIQVAVFVAPGSSTGVSHLRTVAGHKIDSRLQQYPAHVRSLSVEQLLARVSITAVTRPDGDPRIGVVQVRVEGQRRLSGLYGPEMYTDPANPLPSHQTHLEEARKVLVRMAEDHPAFAQAREIMNMYHQPPRVFADQEPPRLHQAHRERHRAANDLVAWDLVRVVPIIPGEEVWAAETRARALVATVGWPRESRLLGGAPRDDRAGQASEAGSSRSTGSERMVDVASRLPDGDALAGLWERLAGTEGRMFDSAGGPVRVWAVLSDDGPLFEVGSDASRSELTPQEFVSWVAEHEVSAPESLFAQRDTVSGKGKARQESGPERVPAVVRQATGPAASSDLVTVHDGRGTPYANARNSQALLASMLPGKTTLASVADLPGTLFSWAVGTHLSIASWRDGRIHLHSDGRVGTSETSGGGPAASADLVNWTPSPAGKTLADEVRDISLVNDKNLKLLMGKNNPTPMPVELWKLVQDQLELDAVPPELARNWAGSPSVHRLGDERAAEASGNVLSPWEIGAAKGRARAYLETRTTDFGTLHEPASRKIKLMVEGFVDAAVQARPESLPSIRGEVFVGPRSLGAVTVTSLLARIDSTINARLAEYPKNTVTTSAKQLSERVSVHALTLADADPRIGVVEVRVDGQRELNGLYGPSAYSDPKNPLPRLKTFVAVTRKQLAGVDRNSPEFSRAREIMDRFHQPPQEFAGLPPRMHQAHRERHLAATELIAWMLYSSDPRSAVLAVRVAENLVPDVGWPRPSRIDGVPTLSRVITGHPSADREVAALALPRNTGVAFVDPRFFGNVVKAFAERTDDSVPVVVHHRDGRFSLPDSAGQRGSAGYRVLAESLASMPARLIEWQKFSRVVLYACDLPKEAPGRLQAGLAEIPALSHLKVEAYFLGERVHFLPEGTVVTGDMTGLPDGTLTLAPSARESVRDFFAGFRTALTTAVYLSRWSGRVEVDSQGTVTGTRPTPLSGLVGREPTAFGRTLTPPDVLAWRPFLDGAEPSTLNEYVRNRSIVNQARFDDFLSTGTKILGLPKEIWNLVRMQLILDPDSTPLNWAGDWAQEMAHAERPRLARADDLTPTGPYGRDEIRQLSGFALNSAGAQLAWHRARIAYETRLDFGRGELPEEARSHIHMMVEGFVDAAARAHPGELPRVRGEVVVPKGQSGWANLVRSQVKKTVEQRLEEYPAGAVPLTAKQLSGQISISVITRPRRDVEIGKVRLRVDGQRALSGLYGPEAFTDPNDPWPGRARLLSQARERLALTKPDEPVFAKAREIMNRYNQPPRVFAGQEPPLHRAHRLRYEGAVELIASGLMARVELKELEETARLLGDVVGMPRLGGAPVPSKGLFALHSPAGGRVAALALEHNTGVAFVGPAYFTHVSRAFAPTRTDALPLVVHHRAGRWDLPRADGSLVPHSSRELAEVLARVPAELVSWGAIEQIELFACDVTQAEVFSLRAALRDIPSLAEISVTTRLPNRSVRILPNGRISGDHRGADVAPGALVLGTNAATHAGDSVVAARNLYGEENLISLLPDDVDAAVVSGSWANATPHSLRMIRREINQYGETQVEFAPWAPLVTDHRPSPLVLRLWPRGSGFGVGPEILTPAETMRRLHDSEAFQRYLREPVRRPIIVLSSENQTVSDQRVGEFLNALIGMVRPVQLVSYQGRYVMAEGGLRFPQSPRVGYSLVAPLPDLELSAGPDVFTLSGTAGAPATATARKIAAAVTAKWGTARSEPAPLVMVVPGDDTVAHVAVRSRDVRLPLGGREIAELFLSVPGARQVLASDARKPVVLVGDFDAREARPGGIRFDVSATLAAHGLFNSVYATNSDASSGFQLVSGLFADRVRTELVFGPDRLPAALFVRHEGDEIALRQVQAWAGGAASTMGQVVLGPDGQKVETPWHNALPIFVKPAGAGRIHLKRSDGEPAVGEPGLALRDSMELRMALGREADGQSWPQDERTPFLIPVEGRLSELEKFTTDLAGGGYSRATVAARGPVELRSLRQIRLTEQGFDRVPAVLPTPAQFVSHPLKTPDSAVHGVFFPRDHVDLVRFATVDARTGPLLSGGYFHFPTKPGNPHLTPGGAPSWRTIVHGSRANVWMALPAALPYDLGDRFTVTGDTAADAFFAASAYQRVHPDRNRPFRLLSCNVAHNKKLIEAVKARWGNGAIIAPTSVVYLGGKIAGAALDARSHLVRADGTRPPKLALADLAVEHIPQRKITRDAGNVLPKNVQAAVRTAVRASVWRVISGAEPVRIRITVGGKHEGDGMSWGKELAAGIQKLARSEASQLSKHYSLPAEGARRMPIDVVYALKDEHPAVAHVKFDLAEGDFGQKSLATRDLDQITRVFAALVPNSEGIAQGGPVQPKAGALEGPGQPFAASSSSGPSVPVSQAGHLTPTPESESAPGWLLDGNVPYGALSGWRPPASGEARAATWYEAVREREFRTVDQLSRSALLLPELGLEVKDTFSVEVDWVRAWVESMDSVRGPDGFRYKDEALAELTGVGLTKWEVAQARGNARVNLKDRLDEDGNLTYNGKASLYLMVDGFVDAAVQASPDALPRVRGAVFAAGQALEGAAKVEALVKERARLRLAQHPEEVVTITLEQVLARVEVEVITRPEGHEESGLARFRVDGQRELSGLYGPEAYSKPDNPLPRREDLLATARQEIAQWDPSAPEVVELFTQAEQIMKRYHQPPLEFDGPEKPRIHQAHEERYSAARDLIAFQLAQTNQSFEANLYSADSVARLLIGEVGWPRPSTFVGGTV